MPMNGQGSTVGQETRSAFQVQRVAGHPTLTSASSSRSNVWLEPGTCTAGRRASHRARFELAAMCVTSDLLSASVRGADMGRWSAPRIPEHYFDRRRGGATVPGSRAFSILTARGWDTVACTLPVCGLLDQLPFLGRDGHV